MKVAELIAHLSTLDPSLEVLGYSEDRGVLAPEHEFRLLSLAGVELSVAEARRGDDDVPTLRFGAGPDSRRFALLHLTAEF